MAADVADAYAKGAAVKALARRYDVAPTTIRKVLDVAGARCVLEERDGVPADVIVRTLAELIDQGGAPVLRVTVINLLRTRRST